MKADQITRRNFIAASTTAAMLAATPAASAAAVGANDRIRIGLIGVGGRMSAHLRSLQALAKSQNVEIAAICDVWRVNREAAVAKVAQAGGKTPESFSRYQDLLAVKDIDGVVVATPDFSHMPITIAALKAGKDVYVEKPMSLTIEDANQAFDLAREKQRIVQVGTQRRSEGAFRAGQKIVATGALGTVSRVSAGMGFNQQRWFRADVSDCKESDVDWDAFLMGTPKRPFDPKLLRMWQLYKLCTNGLAGLWMPHYIDLVHLITGAKYPTSGVAHGGTYVWKDGREHTDSFHAVLEYPEGFLVNWGMYLGSDSGSVLTVYGTKGLLDMEKRTLDLDPVPPKKNRESSKVQSEPNQDHMANWLECMRSRKLPNADIQYGHQHAVATIMAATALNTARRQAYDVKKRELHAG